MDARPSPANTPSLPAWTWPERRPAGDGGKPATRRLTAATHLQWLAAHQCLDGHWNPAHFAGWCEGTDHSSPPGTDAGWDQHEVAVTALAALAFLSYGFTPRGDHEFVHVIRRALAWLKAAQGATGFICTRSHPTWLWDHALATLAMVEAYRMTESALWRAPARSALDALSRSRAPGTGVWSHGLQADGLEESLTLWAVQPIYLARSIQQDFLRRGKPPTLEVDEPALAATQAWLERGTDATTGMLALGRAGAQAPDLPGSSPRGIAALGLLVRVLDCQDPKADGPLKRGGTTLETWRPDPREAREAGDDILWWAGALAAYGSGGSLWKSWSGELFELVLAQQAEGSDPCGNRGSWTPRGDIGRLGGRVASTALMTLCISVCTRYGPDPLVLCPPPPEPAAAPQPAHSK